jgi:AraC-like DNA-binding protein
MGNATSLKPRSRPERDPQVLAGLLRQRQEWLAAIDPADHIHRLFDHIPGVYFFAKNKEGRLMFASEGLRNHYAMTHETEILGMTDFDLNPDMMAKAYVDDDKLLLAGKTRLVERIELWWDQQQMPDWYLVTKLPIHDQKGRVTGIIGVLRRPQEAELHLPVFQTVARAVDLIRRHYAEPLNLKNLAGTCGQSLRQLQRHFQSAFGLTPQEFLLKTRVLAAMALLRETTLSIAEVAARCGFVDASSFSAHFRKRTGASPKKFRSGD